MKLKTDLFLEVSSARHGLVGLDGGHAVRRFQRRRLVVPDAAGERDTGAALFFSF
jgi:hypothetical protein